MNESFQDLEAELRKLRPHSLSARLIKGVAADLSNAAGQKAGTGASREAAAPSIWRRLDWRVAFTAAMVVATLSTLAVLKFRKVESAEVTKPAVAPSAPLASTQDAAGTAKTEDRYEPVAVANILYDLQDEGPVASEGDIALRRVRYRYLDTYTWKNPRSNASLKWSVPRDEIRMLPVSYN